MKRKGFTLIEILIVVIILGILAAIVIPQFTDASNDARVSAMVSDLQTVRSQIELYKVQHLDDYPGTVGGTWSAANFVTTLSTMTDEHGNSGGDLGPYLQKFPTNPFNASNAVRDATGASDPNAESGTEGWWFNSTLGTFGVNTTEYIDW